MNTLKAIQNFSKTYRAKEMRMGDCATFRADRLTWPNCWMAG